MNGVGNPTRKLGSAQQRALDCLTSEWQPIEDVARVVGCARRDTIRAVEGLAVHVPDVEIERTDVWRFSRWETDVKVRRRG